MSDDHSSNSNYIKIWAILVGLLVVSVVGPMLEIKALTLITAFGVACIKAYLVAKNFMHINRVPRFVPYIVATCLLFMLLFFAGTAPDVMQDDGSLWEKPSWKADALAASSNIQEPAGHH